MYLLAAILKIKHTLHLYTLLKAEEYAVFMKREYLILWLGRPLLDIPVFYSKSYQSPQCHRALKLLKLVFFQIAEESCWRKSSCAICSAET